MRRRKGKSFRVWGKGEITKGRREGGRELLKAEVGGERKKIRVFERVGRGKAERRKGRNRGWKSQEANNSTWKQKEIIRRNGKWRRAEDIRSLTHQGKRWAEQPSFSGSLWILEGPWGWADEWVACGRTSSHLNDWGFSFHFLCAVRDLSSVLSMEPNEFLLSLYSSCPFHLNLPPILFTRVYSSECRVLNCLCFLQPSLNADSGKWFSCQKEKLRVRSKWRLMGRRCFLLSYTCSVCWPACTEGASQDLCLPKLWQVGRSGKGLAAWKLRCVPALLWLSRCAWASHLSFLSWGFLICKLRLVHLPLLHESWEGNLI